MKTGLESSFRESKGSFTYSREFPPAGIGSSMAGQRREEEKRVRFDIPGSSATMQKSVDLKGRKYEGFSSLPQKGILTKGKPGEKENVKKVNLDDDFIHNLHQHIYYLEMQLKLLKDKDIESKKGGLDALFSDGIPLNEHFLALKNKYKKEKKDLENKINELNSQMAEISGNNRSTAVLLDRISEEYESFLKNSEIQMARYNNRERDFRVKLTSEKKILAETKAELDVKAKELSKLKSDNDMRIRMQEKNKMITEKKEEKNLLEEEEKNNEAIEYFKKKVVDAGVNLERCKKAFDDMSLIKQFDNENLELVKKEGNLSTTLKVAEGKIAELENLQEMNRKSIEEETYQKKKVLKENEFLQKELEHKSKLKEDELQEYFKEIERHQIIETQTKIDIDSQEMEYFINFQSDTEKQVKALAEEKANLQEKLGEATDEISRRVKEKQEQTSELQICQNSNELALVDLEKTNKEYVFLQKNNKDLQIENEKIQANITELGVEIEKVQQRAQINEILKDVDLDELKMLSQNNLTVNSAIANLVSKLDIIEGKQFNE